MKNIKDLPLCRHYRDFRKVKLGEIIVHSYSDIIMEFRQLGIEGTKVKTDIQGQHISKVAKENGWNACSEINMETKDLHMWFVEATEKK